MKEYLNCVLFGLFFFMTLAHIDAATIRWDGGAGTDQWSDANNWSTNTVPTSSDDVILNNDFVGGSYSVELPSGTVQVIVLSIVIQPSAGSIQLTLPTSNNAQDAFLPGSATLHSGAILLNSGTFSSTGHTFRTTNGANSFIIYNGARYIHNTARQNTNIVANLSQISGTEYGVFEYDVPVNGVYGISAAARTYGTLEFSNYAGNGALQYTTTGANPVNVRGDFQLNSNATYSSSNQMTGALQLSGNLISNGNSLTFNNQPVLFVGSAVQNIQGSSPTLTLNNATVNNASGVELLREVFVGGSGTGVLTFTSGILRTNDFTLIHNNTAAGAIVGQNTSRFICTCTSGGNSASTGGLLLKTVNSTSRTFPIGPVPTSYNPITIANSGTVDNFTARAIDDVFDEGTSGNLITANVVDCSWILTEEVSGGSSLNMTLQWNGANELPSFTRSSCYVTRYVGPGPVWSGTTPGAASGSNPYTRSRNGITSLTAFTVASNGALPISLLSFTATPNNNHTDLLWATATETQNAYFSLERSADGVHFDEIAQVPGAGNSAATKNYAYTDRSPINGPNYYRLRQVDFDGAYSFSPVRRVVFGQTNAVRLQPVPAIETLQVLLDEVPSEHIAWSVYDQAGRLVLNGYEAEETAQFDVDVQTIPQGVYMLRLTSGQLMHTMRFVKQQ